MGNSQTHPHPLVLSIMEFTPVADRAKMCLISKDYHRLSQEMYVQKWMCFRLMEDFKLYHPLKLLPGRSWKQIYTDLRSLAGLWSPSSGVDTSSRAKIQVYSRFRPHNKNYADVSMDECDATEKEPKSITLPLHQRLTLIKLSHGLKTNRQALQVLKEEGSWFKKKWDDIDNCEDRENDKENSAENLRNGYKTKASCQREQAPLTSDIQSIDPATGRVVIVAPDVGMREFSFDGVLPGNSTQSQAYDRIASGLVTDVLNGCNATGIMYGQTGSGKTYTMFGPDVDDKKNGPSSSSFSYKKDNHGIVLRACEEIFEAIVDRKARHGIEAEVWVSFVEVYGDTVSDLLLNGKRCGHSKAASQQFVLSGAAEQGVENMQDVRRLLQIGEAQKRRAATALNDRSTRAHSIFILTLKQRLLRDSQSYSEIEVEGSGLTTLTSKLFLADLGGSEQVKKSKVEAGKFKSRLANNNNNEELSEAEARDQALYSTGFEMAERMREAVYINLGLLALKKCIEALNSKCSYVPYQDSKLTMLLSAGLATGKTSVVVCINSDPTHMTETIGTLRFGERCSLIETEVRTNVSMLESVLHKLNVEIKNLEEVIKQKEVWENVEEKRVDALAEEGTMEASLGVERKLVTVLRGAEKERAMLNSLLLQLAELTGSDSVAEVLNKSGISTFGGKYDKNLSYGVKYDPNQDLKSDNTRFASKIDRSSTSAVVQKKGKDWKTGEDLAISQTELERKAIVAKRNKLVYSGLAL